MFPLTGEHKGILKQEINLHLQIGLKYLIIGAYCCWIMGKQTLSYDTFENINGYKYSWGVIQQCFKRLKHIHVL